MRTHIQTDYRDQLIKVTPADSEFCETHLKKPAVSHRYYTIIPAGRPTRTPASPDKVNRCVYSIEYFLELLSECPSLSVFNCYRPIPWIQEDIKKRLKIFLRQIEECDRKDDFRIGYEARQVSSMESIFR